MTPRLELDIDELRLTGFDPHGRAELQAHIQRLLAERMAFEADAWAGVGDLRIERLDIGRIAPGDNRRITAQRIANGIHDALVPLRDTRAIP